MIRRLFIVAVALMPIDAGINRVTADEPANPRADSQMPTSDPFDAESAHEGPLRSATPITPRRQPITKPDEAEKSPSGVSFWTTFWALTVVVVLIVCAAKLWQKHGPGLNHALPSEVIEVLGRKHLDSRQSILVIRCGRKILLMGSTTGGLQTLSEISDPIEVDYLSGLCGPSRDRPTIADSFRDLLTGSREEASRESSEERSETIPVEERLRERMQHLEPERTEPVPSSAAS